MIQDHYNERILKTSIADNLVDKVFAKNKFGTVFLTHNVDTYMVTKCKQISQVFIKVIS